ncbi:putative glycerate dehydrogenase [Selenomonas sp. oral taxon 892 str. F0426]|uniref:D-2-hydroxyacid dehydrogenase n=1 Tax=Selenomonas sp. oral taxon 892 TaxID=1321785 RepID=UPI0003AD557C|nr:D-2-hydroxyacid dehydrogenase [Selenomonas sp. oral taxon 892]ERJ95726.1 putative glycerate dehydrogenase [Selenomonas sp. oral taxon 892 str. F0426]
MKIVVLDGYAENPGDISWAPLEALGELTAHDRTSLTESPLIAQRIGDAEIAVTNKTPITRAVIDACPNLKAIAVLATGYNVVDTVYAREKSIPVMNVPVYGTDNVAQYAIALLLEACSHIGHHDRSVHAGDWTKSIDFCYWQRPLIEVSGKTAGIIGFGRIGMAVARILRAMNVRVLAYSRTERAEGRTLADYVPLDDLLTQSDFIFLHCPLTPETDGIISAANIAKMKDGVIIVNNGRGQLIVEADLAAALTSGKLGGAAVDVASTEPIAADNPLLHAPNCIITPHISWATKEARERIMQMTADNVRAFMDGTPTNVVN